MDRDEYFRLYHRAEEKQRQRIQEALAKLKAELDEERQRDIDALNRTWTLANNTAPPEFSAPEQVRVSVPQEAQSNGNSVAPPELHTRNHRIRHAARQVEGNIVTQPLVREKLKELFPKDELGLDGTIISKNLRAMEDAGELRTIQEASRNGSVPRVFEKVNVMNS
jgi:hypothetical protein